MPASYQKGSALGCRHDGRTRPARGRVAPGRARGEPRARGAGEPAPRQPARARARAARLCPNDLSAKATISHKVPSVLLTLTVSSRGERTRASGLLYCGVGRQIASALYGAFHSTLSSLLRSLTKGDAGSLNDMLISALGTPRPVRGPQSAKPGVPSAPISICALTFSSRSRS